MLVWLTRKENKSVLDQQLQEQLNEETKFYHNVQWIRPQICLTITNLLLYYDTVFGAKCMKDVYLSLKLVVILA